MRLKMEIIFFVKMCHTSTGSSLTSVSTYLTNKSTGRQSLNLRGVGVRFSYMLLRKNLIYHRVVIWLQGFMGVMPLPWQIVGLELSKGRQLFPF